MARLSQWLDRHRSLRSVLVASATWFILWLATEAMRSLWPGQVDTFFRIVFIIGFIALIPFAAYGLYREYGQPPRRR